MSTLNIRTPTNAPTRKSGPSPATREQRRTGAGIAPPARRAANSEVTPEAIRARAHEIFQARQKTGAAGDSVSDWLCAEQECICGKGRATSTQDQLPGLNFLLDP